VECHYSCTQKLGLCIKTIENAVWTLSIARFIVWNEIPSSELIAETAEDDALLTDAKFAEHTEGATIFHTH